MTRQFGSRFLLGCIAAAVMAVVSVQRAEAHYLAGLENRCASCRATDEAAGGASRCAVCGTDASKTIVGNFSRRDRVEPPYGSSIRRRGLSARNRNGGIR
jgi:hypothetical protein